MASIVKNIKDFFISAKTLLGRGPKPPEVKTVARSYSVASMTGIGVQDVNAVAAILRRTASMPLAGAGILGSVRQRVLQIDTGTDQKPKPIIGSALVFSEPHLIRAKPLIDTESIAIRARLDRAKSLIRAGVASRPQAKLSKQRGASSLNTDSKQAADPQEAMPGEEIQILASDLELALQGGMPTNDPVVTRFQSLIGDLLGANASHKSALGLSSSTLDASPSHDFSQYVFARDPSSLLNVNLPATVQPPADFDAFLSRSQQIIETVVYAYCQTEHDVGPGYFSISYTQYFPGFIDSIFRLFSTYVGTSLYALYRSVIPGYAGGSGDVMGDVLGAFEQWLIRVCNDTGYKAGDITHSFDNPALWVDAPAAIVNGFHATFPGVQTTSYLGKGAEAYDFRPYTTSTINFGLRLVFRQSWQPLGNQTGEIVRTIPLGPKQSEKISFKTITTRKENRSTENATSVESSQEGSTSVKDSSEVVSEASEKFKWHVDAEAGVNIGFVSGKVNAGASDETSNNSKDTKTRLNESMLKSASRMRRDTKVLVSTEVSTTDETTHASEIINPNDEIAITYVYSKLQRQYNVFTELAEVNSVIFVPEAIPPFAEVNSTWVRGHASSLLRVLLDPMYESDIRQVVQEPDAIDFSDVNSKSRADLLGANLLAATNGIAQISANKATYVPDFVGPSLEAHTRELANARAKASDEQRREYRRASLYDHLRRNILHYMRAIWADEDRDQRWLRYSQIQVPTRWIHDGIGSTGGNAPYRDGRFRPDYSPDSMRPLTDVISPTGPIGYAGNYAVFLMQASPTLANLNEALMALRSHYVEFTATLFDASAVNPETIRDAIAYDPIDHRSDYKISYDPNRSPVWNAFLIVQGGNTEVPIQELKGLGLDIDHAVLVWLASKPASACEYILQVRGSAALQDPHLRLIRMTYPLPLELEEATTFTPSLLGEMTRLLPDVFEAIGNTVDWDKLDPKGKTIARHRYHTFLLVRESTTRVALDTNNLVLDLEVGETPALETFKRLHRYVDVLKEVEERLKRRLENLRRVARIKESNLADPEIEHVTVVGRGSELGSLVDTLDKSTET